MTAPAVEIRLQTPNDLPALKKLNEDSFGPGRFARTAFRLREEAGAEPRLNLCVVEGGAIAGSVLFTPIAIGGAGGALLLGPLIVAKNHNNQGYGLRLMREGMARGRDLGYALVILVGDLPYYARAGFAVCPAGRITLPGPVDPSRLLYSELVPGALERYAGLARGAPPCIGKIAQPRSESACAPQISTALAPVTGVAAAPPEQPALVPRGKGGYR
jgi:predicted N-acetyltransferase YhbS